MGPRGIRFQLVCGAAAAVLLLVACQGAALHHVPAPVATATPSPAAPQHWQSPSTPVLPRITPTRSELMARGQREYDFAEQLPAEGYERPRWWLAAAQDYDAAFRDAPTIDDAPGAALNGAYAYRQVGEYAKAIDLYELFIASYGSESILALLQNGDAQAEPPIAANARLYEMRVTYVGSAYEEWTTLLVALGNYQRAADILETASKNARLPETWRQEATRKAQSLRAMPARPAPARP